MKFKPLSDKLLVCRIEEAKASKGGIIIPDAAQDKGHRAKVVATGPGRRDESGKHIPMAVKAGDTILLGKWVGSEIKLDGEEYLIVGEDEVLAVET